MSCRAPDIGVRSFLQSTNVSHNFPRRDFAPAAQRQCMPCRIITIIIDLLEDEKIWNYLLSILLFHYLISSLLLFHIGKEFSLKPDIMRFFFSILF